MNLVFQRVSYFPCNLPFYFSVLYMAAGAISERQVLFLERGHPGIVPCSRTASRAYTLANLEAAYWYLGQYGRDGFLLSLTPDGYYRERIPEGVYNISSDFNLIIQNVTTPMKGCITTGLSRYLAQYTRDLWMWLSKVGTSNAMLT